MDSNDGLYFFFAAVSGDYYDTIVCSCADGEFDEEVLIPSTSPIYGIMTPYLRNKLLLHFNKIWQIYQNNSLTFLTGENRILETLTFQIDHFTFSMSINLLRKIFNEATYFEPSEIKTLSKFFNGVDIYELEFDFLDHYLNSLSMKKNEFMQRERFRDLYIESVDLYYKYFNDNSKY